MNFLIHWNHGSESLPQPLSSNIINSNKLNQFWPTLDLPLEGRMIVRSTNPPTNSQHLAMFMRHLPKDNTLHYAPRLWKERGHFLIIVAVSTHKLSEGLMTHFPFGSDCTRTLLSPLKPPTVERLQRLATRCGVFCVEQ
uniref:(California timema) hypothetical protein n=1 Tax=Timema californicum TaxID=61474 RepID=A0A7R9J8C3_TIMCA|nr:unnamed protein product [Timema californicum]